jgi:6,7-dimethyl-8-ribityllumazine synthase
MAMAAAPHVMVVEARFYPDIADELAKGAIAALEKAGASYERFAVPGVLEIPAAINMAIRAAIRVKRRPFDAYLVLGCVIRGETTHYDIVCNESARGVQDLVIEHDLALGFGVLTVENDDQAWVRARVNKKNKGGEAAEACLAMFELKRRLGL